MCWGEVPGADLSPGSTPAVLQLPGAAAVESVALGEYHCAAADRHGRIYTWGSDGWTTGAERVGLTGHKRDSVQRCHTTLEESALDMLEVGAQHSFSEANNVLRPVALVSVGTNATYIYTSRSSTSISPGVPHPRS